MRSQGIPSRMLLKTVTRTQGNNQDLKAGRVKPRTFEFDFEEVPVLVDAFRRMVRGHEFDISEMAITTYLCAREHGKRFTALPIFLVRAFHHGAIVHNVKSGIGVPKDLEGRKVGVNRGYTVTTGLWARSILQDEYGVDLSKITWVLSGDEHVEEYQPPANVVSMPAGQTLADMVSTGELAAAIGVDVAHADVRPLIPNSQDAGIEALRHRGHYPINHLIVVRNDRLDSLPDLARDVFDVFTEAKRRYLQRLTDGAIGAPTEVDRMHQRVMEIIGDPLPYGIEPNRRVLEDLIDHARTQGIISRKMAPEDMFPSTTHALAG